MQTDGEQSLHASLSGVWGWEDPWRCQRKAIANVLPLTLSRATRLRNDQWPHMGQIDGIALCNNLGALVNVRVSALHEI